MEQTLTDKEKTEAWIDLAIYHGWLKEKLPEEAFDELSINFGDTGSAILINQFVVDNKRIVYDLIKKSNDAKLAFLTLQLINGMFYFREDQLKALYFFWYAIIKEYKDRYDFDFPEKIIPKYYQNDVHGVIEEVKEQYQEIRKEYEDE